MASLSEEEDNYIRFALLLKGVTPRAVRTFFDNEFPPTYLPSTLNENYDKLYNLKLRRVLNQVQWNLLFPKNGVPNSRTFDATLMVCLIRNLTSINEPINGFDSLPLPVETTPGPDLARIKWHRNKFAHHDSDKIGTVEFNTAWREISDAVSRLGGQPMNQECKDLKSKILDKSNQEIMLEIKQSSEETRQAILLLKDTIPWNIRGQIEEELEAWKDQDKMFIETNASKSILKYIQENGCVVVTGSSGTGKSSLVRHVALKLQTGHGYDILPISNPEDIIRWYNPDKNVLFVVDDFCGVYTLNQTNFERWNSLLEKIKTFVEMKSVKLIMSCRLQVYKDEKMKSLSFFQSYECNLLSEEMCLSKTEKKSIAKIYLKKGASKIIEFYDSFDCFPLLCQLYSKNTNLSIKELFKNPYTVYKDEINKLQTEGAHLKYCALALCVMFNNHLKEKWFTEDVDSDIKTIIKNTYEACKVVTGTSRLVLRDELDSLTNTFIRKDGKIYRTIHDMLFDFLAFYFGSVMINCLIANASSSLIRERFLFEKGSNSDDFIITVPDIYQQTYFKRLVCDWLSGNVEDVYCNINMNNVIFRQRFLMYIKSLEILQQNQLASSFDTNDDSTPLIQCCTDGNIDLVKWCLDHCIGNINHCRLNEKASPLFIACQKGHTEVVQVLINNKAEINKCRDDGTSPLFIASGKGHTGVVHILIKNKADINKCRDTGTSPLFIACGKGHTEVVQMLVTNRADINKCRNNGMSPLFNPCGKGYTEIVQILINNKIDINKCNETGTSALWMACQEGQTEIVKMLIDNKANVNKCRENGSSPLLIACWNGHFDVVQILINNKADINKCNCIGESPFFIACQRGHTEVVNILMNNKADILKCNHKKVSPLDIAREKRHTEIVQMLIQNTNISGNLEASTLFISWHDGQSEV